LEVIEIAGFGIRQQYHCCRKLTIFFTGLSSTHVVATFAVASGLPIVIIVALSFFNL